MRLTESEVNLFYMAQWLRGLDSDLQIESQGYKPNTDITFPIEEGFVK